jgi:hypothetical protein
VAQPPAPGGTIFFENFINNDMGWIYYSPDGKVRPLPICDGILYCYSPWWVDYNHAPPGAGYLHIMMGLHTNASGKWEQRKLPRDFTNAKVTVRLRGDVDLKGSQLVFHCQANNGKTTANFVLKSQPLQITHDWSEQAITLVPDPNQWTCLGSRRDRMDFYGCYDIRDALKNMNVDFIFMLFPLNIEPVENILDKHAIQAGYRYHVKQELLPSGVLMFDWIKIEFAK